MNLQVSYDVDTSFNRDMVLTKRNKNNTRRTSSLTARFRKIGENWKEVILAILLSSYQSSLLIYYYTIKSIGYVVKVSDLFFN